MLALYVHVLTASSAAFRAVLGRMRARRRHLDERGQTSAEYALVLLGAAAVALLVVAWATRTNKVGKLLDGVFDKVIGQIT